VQRTVANTVVGQMLAPGIMKGGAPMSVRVGEAGSRFTADLDAARPVGIALDSYLDEFARRLDEGWGGFTATLEQLPPARPEGVPEDYVMQPFKIRLLYLGRHWLTVPFELGHDEINSTEIHDLCIAPDIVDLFATFGLDEPQPIPLLTVEHQIAQKLHACTTLDGRTGKNDRAHDLVDLQISRLRPQASSDCRRPGRTHRVRAWTSIDEIVVVNPHGPWMFAITTGALRPWFARRPPAAIARPGPSSWHVSPHEGDAVVPSDGFRR
jgi:hypothetical protein